MKDIPTLTINLDAKCQICKKPGATPSGICLDCVTKGVISGKYDHILKRGEAMKSKLTNQEISKLQDEIVDLLNQRADAEERLANVKKAHKEIQDSIKEVIEHSDVLIERNRKQINSGERDPEQGELI